MNNNTTMLKEIHETLERLPECSKYNEQNLQDIVTAIKEFKPNNIVIVARGTSLHSAMYAKYLLEIYYKIPVSLAAKSVFTVYDTDMDLSKSLVIAISQSGKAKDITKAIDKANASGALTVGITNELDSITHKACKYNLYCNVNKAVAYAATKTYTSTMYLITKLTYLLTNNEKLNLDDAFLVENLKTALNHYDEIRELVKLYKDTNDLFTLGRGIPYSLAMECGLKIKETSHFHVSTYPASEFYHGPIVMANKNIQAICFALDKITNPDIKTVLNSLKKLDVNTLVITNDKNLLDLANNHIYINQDNDLYALFQAIIILQLFACELSVLRGNNPDFVDVLEHIDTY